MRTYGYQRYIVSHSSGSTVKHTSPSNIGSYTFKCPNIQYQKSIASILDNLDDKIEVNRRINENLEQQAQALFKSWFVDFEPFKNGEFVESELGMIPKGWRVLEAQDIFSINIGKTPPRKEQEWFTENDEDNIWVSIADMGSCGMFISDSSEYLINDAIKRFNIQMVEKNSVLLSFKLTVGRVAIAGARLTTNEAIARFILPDEHYREFLYLYLKQYKYGNLGSTSSIATAVNSKTIKGMKLLFSSTDIISAFSKKTKPLFDKIEVLLKESRRLAQLRDTLLPRLMSGELKVNEIENVL
jgi:type I restriction enzyme S subunit